MSDKNINLCLFVNNGLIVARVRTVLEAMIEILFKSFKINLGYYIRIQIDRTKEMMFLYRSVYIQ